MRYVSKMAGSWRGETELGPEGGCRAVLHCWGTEARGGCTGSGGLGGIALLEWELVSRDVLTSFTRFSVVLGVCWLS
jgi:hypothetical protein